MNALTGQEKSPLYFEKYAELSFHIFPVITSLFLCPERASKGNCNVTARKAISKIHTQFDLVLIGDHLDESLILMKNYLNWSITDVTYTSSKNEFHLGVAPTLIQVTISRNNLQVL